MILVWEDGCVMESWVAHHPPARQAGSPPPQFPLLRMTMYNRNVLRRSGVQAQRAGSVVAAGFQPAGWAGEYQQLIPYRIRAPEPGEGTIKPVVICYLQSG